jgi:hypothetical protein
MSIVNETAKTEIPTFLMARYKRMMALAAEAGCDLTTGEEWSVLHNLMPASVSWDRHPLTDAQIADLIEHFIAIGCELDARTGSGETPLHTSCLFGLYHSFQLLAEKGADVTAVDARAYSSLHMLLIEHHSLTSIDRSWGLRDALITALVKRCDPNGLSLAAGTPSDIAIQTDGFQWVQWEKALSHVGYALLQLAADDKRYPSPVWVVVSSEHPDGAKLPVSNLTLDEWLGKRARIRKTNLEGAEP